MTEQEILKEEYDAEIVRLNKTIEELQKDSKRLDWVLNQRMQLDNPEPNRWRVLNIYSRIFAEGSTYREAIDNAMGAEK